jgi:predicted Zn finger-like uncharacterized protein
MILTCPQCATRYHVDPGSLGPTGRRVRCSNCQHRWVAEPPSDTPRVVELDIPEPSPGARPRPGIVIADKTRGRGSASLVAWLVAVLVVLILASAVIGRNEIVSGFPASATIYQKLGLPVTVQLGLQFEDVASRRLDQGGVVVLVVEGAIVNLSGEGRPVPPIRITLLDAEQRPLQHELFDAESRHLDDGARTSFSARLVNPPEQARNFSITFDAAS